MKNLQKRGFTLMELLVVVLIIGILAAVALPQYQKAVEKSRIAKAFTVLRSLSVAAQLYYLENGTYTGINQEKTSIQFPQDTIKHFTLLDGNGRVYEDGKIYSISMERIPQYYLLAEQKQGGTIRYWCVPTQEKSINLCASFSKNCRSVNTYCLIEN